MAKINKIDSNQTGLRYAEEDSLGVLPAAASQIWQPLEPNSYSDFGSQVTTVARNPINSSRKRKKGVVTDVNASGGFKTDITQDNLQDILQGFFFADLRRKVEENTFTAVTASTKKYSKVTSDLVVGDLVLASGFTVAGNNGLKRVTAVDGTDVTVNETSFDETPSASAKLVQVGFQFATGDLVVTQAALTLPTLTTTVKDMTDFGLIAGEFVYIGSDETDTSFAAQPTNNGFARVRSVSDDGKTIVLDKTAGSMVTDTAAAKTIRIYFGRVLKDETGTEIVRRSYNLERTLGYNDDDDSTKIQAENLVGSIANDFTLNVPTAEKVTCDLSFVSLHSTTADENLSESILSKAAVSAGSAANAPEIVEADAFNTSTDVTRIKLSTVSPIDSNPDPLFAFVQEFTVKINNNASGNKAVGVVGSFEVSVGTFEVGGSMTAYFADVAAVRAVQNNANITLDAHFVKANAGFSFDLPLITLGNGRPQVEQDKPITLPLDNLAATGALIHPDLNHTAMLTFWDYLPTVAE